MSTLPCTKLVSFMRCSSQPETSRACESAMVSRRAASRCSASDKCMYISVAVSAMMAQSAMESGPVRRFNSVEFWRWWVMRMSGLLPAIGKS